MPEDWRKYMNKNVRNGIIVVVILLLAVVLKLNSDQKHNTSSLTLFTGQIEDIQKILIQKGEDAIELYREDEIWKIAGNDTLDIRENRITNFFDNVLTAGRETLVSTNPEKWGTYSVDDSTGLHLALINDADETFGYFVFGRSKKDWSHNYIRTDNDPDVYLTSTSIIHHLNARDTFWGEKPKPVEIPEDSINIQIDSLEISQSSGE